jgi:hypothetical protein
MRLLGVLESVHERELNGGMIVEIAVRDSDGGRVVRGRFRGLVESVRVGEKYEFGVELLNREYEGVWRTFVVLWRV